MRIGIVTMPLRCNYGGALQAYALQSFLQSQGHDTVIIDCQRRAPLLSRLHHWVERNILHYHFTRFGKQMMYRTPILDNDKILQQVASCCDAVIVGSDQVWRLSMIRGVERNYFLDFVPDTTRRIAYAASFGLDDLEPCDEALYHDIAQLITRFNALSVREASGVEICRRHWQREARHVLDPTLLAGREVFARLARQAQPSGGELFYFFLGKREAETEQLHSLATTAGKRAFTVNAGRTLRIGKFAFAFYPPVEQWVRAFSDAEVIVTDSFHGVCFSLLFGKPFYILGNESGGTSRIRSLLDMLHLDDRYITSLDTFASYNDLTHHQIDYIPVKNILDAERAASAQFLTNALQS